MLLFKLAPHASFCAYIPLSGCPDLEEEVKGRGGCAFYSKSTRHEHVFPGRVRFDPKEEKYYLPMETLGDFIT